MKAKKSQRKRTKIFWYNNDESDDNPNVIIRPRILDANTVEFFKCEMVNVEMTEELFWYVVKTAVKKNQSFDERACELMELGFLSDLYYKETQVQTKERE